MFVGHYEHSLDSKGRVVLPAKFRGHLSDRAYISQAQRCLALWLPEAFDETVARLLERVREGDMEPNAYSGFLANAEEVSPDKQGRILLPERLRDFAGLRDDVMLLGQDNHVAIWDAERWKQQGSDVDASVAQAFVEGLAI